MENEKRRHSRFEARLRVEIEHGDEKVSGHSHDLSLGGMFVESWRTFPVGEKVVATLSLPALSAPARVECTVRWLIPGGMGLSFGDLGAAETWAINQLAAQQSPRR